MWPQFLLPHFRNQLAVAPSLYSKKPVKKVETEAARRRRRADFMNFLCFFACSIVAAFSVLWTAGHGTDTCFIFCIHFF